VRAERSAQDAQAAPPVAGMAALIGRAPPPDAGIRPARPLAEQAESDPDLAPRAGRERRAVAEQREPGRALRAIEALQSSGARHLHAMRIALSAHVQASTGAT